MTGNERLSKRASRGGSAMNIHDREHRQSGEHVPGTAALIVSLQTLDRTLLPLVGGKAANLGELTRAGFSVPDGFCVTTAAYVLLSDGAGLEPILAELASTRVQETVRLTELAAAARAALLQAPVPASCVKAITEAYQELSDGVPLPMAVRSSATTEDLPEASFAGQQETFLNIVGVEAVLVAVQCCWVSLWTDRAVSYRASLGIDPRTVRLAMVVQRMVDAQVAGVLFTANPLTGKRREIVIDANPGLGEAVVSGATNPDHFVVQTTTGEIVERRLGDKQVLIQAAAGGGIQKIEAGASPTSTCLSDEQVQALAALGARVEALYGTPQDIEWAIDPSGQVFLLQARPITTLFPLPAEAPSTDESLRVYLAFGVQQGTYRPFTPMGLSALRLLASGFLTLIGFPLRDPLAGPRFVTEAASRPFFEVTAALRSPFGRRFLLEAMREAEVHAAASFEHLVTDPRLSLRETPRRVFGRALVLLLARTHLPWYLLQAFLAPQAANTRVQRFVEQVRNAHRLDASADAAAHLAAAERLLLHCLRLAFRVSPVMLAGMQSFALARRMLGELASERECQIVLGGSPTNPTTEMNLALWRLFQEIRADATSRHLLQSLPAETLAQDYQQGRLPAPLQQGVARFLQAYGHQGVCELDLGVPRWSENPTYVLNLLTGYLEIAESAPAPDLQLQRAGREAAAMIATLAQRARHKHWLRGQLVRLCLQRAHALAGFREMTRFVAGLFLAQARELLWPVGEELSQAGRLKEAADIFFLTFPEAHAALTGADLRVILDPHGARLKPGEILVAPSTDPCWTPLFLKASGLVMEVGGAMAHGAIVAREYGIPAVVGVAGATERIATGSRVTLDGTAGTVVIEENSVEQDLL